MENKVKTYKLDLTLPELAVLFAETRFNLAEAIRKGDKHTEERLRSMLIKIVKKMEK